MPQWRAAGQLRCVRAEMPQRRAAAVPTMRSEGGGRAGLHWIQKPCCSLHTAAGRDDVAFSLRTPGAPGLL
ncbi:uncharacterized [Tachysurus ichikawai]